MLEVELFYMQTQKQVLMNERKQNFWPFLAACGESFLLFGGTALVLTAAMQRQWIAPFGQE